MFSEFPLLKGMKLVFQLCLLSQLRELFISPGNLGRHFHVLLDACWSNSSVDVLVSCLSLMLPPEQARAVWLP